MSVVIYKNGERSKCEPHELQYQLGDGWSLTNEPAKKAVETIDKSIKEENIKKPCKKPRRRNKKIEKVLEEIEAIENDSN